MRFGRIARTSLLVGLGFLLQSQPEVSAHETSVKGNIAGVNGGASVVVLNPSQTRVSWLLSSSKGGLIQLKIKKAEDQVGERSNAVGNTMEMDFVVKGVPVLLTEPFDLVNGKTKLKLPSLGLVAGDTIEVRSVTLKDSGGVVFGRLGFVSRTK